MKFLALSLTLLFVIGSSSSCYRVLIDESRIVASQNNLIDAIEIGDEVRIEFDIVINSFPGGWANIIHCGNVDGERQPGIWLHPDSDNSGATHQGFHISYSKTSNGNPWINPDPALVTGQSYNVVLEVTQNSFVVTIDGIERFRDDAYGPHPTFPSRNCYVSDPWYPAADVVVSNLRISEPEECS